MLAQFVLAAYTSLPWLHNPDLVRGVFWWPSGPLLHQYVTSPWPLTVGTHTITRHSTGYLRTS
jgi:hypothetical protein